MIRASAGSSSTLESPRHVGAVLSPAREKLVGHQDAPTAVDDAGLEIGSDHELHRCVLGQRGASLLAAATTLLVAATLPVVAARLVALALLGSALAAACAVVVVSRGQPEDQQQDCDLGDDRSQDQTPRKRSPPRTLSPPPRSTGSACS